MASNGKTNETFSLMDCAIKLTEVLGMIKEY